jgi:hypothetical protein
VCCALSRIPSPWQVVQLGQSLLGDGVRDRRRRPVVRASPGTGREGRGALLGRHQARVGVGREAGAQGHEVARVAEAVVGVTLPRVGVVRRPGKARRGGGGGGREAPAQGFGLVAGDEAHRGDGDGYRGADVHEAGFEHGLHDRGLGAPTVSWAAHFL